MASGEKQVEDGEPAGKKSGWGKTIRQFTSGTIFAAILSALLSFALQTHTSYRARLQLQNQAGIDLQEDILTVTGEIEARFAEIETLLRAGSPADGVEAESVLTTDLQPLVDQWTSARLSFRNRAFQIWGNETAETIFSPRERRFRLDDCNQLTAGNAIVENCEAHLSEEIDRLRSAREAAVTGNFSAYRALDITAFDQAFFFARQSIGRYLTCRKLETDNSPVLREPRMANRCDNIEEVASLAIERGRLMGVARENIAETILRAQL